MRRKKPGGASTSPVDVEASIEALRKAREANAALERQIQHIDELTVRGPTPDDWVELAELLGIPELRDAHNVSSWTQQKRDEVRQKILAASKAKD